MGFRGMMRAALFVGLVAPLAGCGLKSRVRTIEQDVAEVKARMSNIQGSLDRHDDALRELAEQKVQPLELIEPAAYVPPAAPRRRPPNKPRVRDLQEALKNAGFSPGRADNKLGPRTKGAIKKFQRANGLKADGVVGMRTWNKLKWYY